MRYNKFHFLAAFAKAHRIINPDLSYLGIAKLARDHYGLSASSEELTKAIKDLFEEAFEEVKEPAITVLEPTVEQYLKATETKQEPINNFKHDQPGTYLVLGCWHVPFHNKTLTNGVTQLIQDLGGDLKGLILNGDFLDCNSLSGHDKGKFTVTPGLTLLQEYTDGKVVLREFLGALPKDALKVYMYGNHENRWDRYMADMQNAKTPLPSPKEGLGLDELGFKTIESYSSGYLTLGKHLDILHGVYYNTHCAKTHIDRFRGSILFAHTHRIQSYIEGRTGGFNIGWGGDVSSAAFNYADRGVKASWQNGFAIVNIDEKGNYYVQQIICIDGHFYYNNKKY